ncbi:hybrid sensor histidine kinase/response regulator transcription factor [Spirosoma pulveris]
MRYQCFCNALSRCLKVSLLLSWLVGAGSGIVVCGQAPVPKSPFLFSSRHLTVEQGLPNRYVFTVGQDKKGFVWIGTLDNAYRFDGQRFHALPTKANTPQNKRYVPMVNHILTDPVGNLWLTGYLNTEYDKLLILPPGKTTPLPVEVAFKQASLFRNDPITAFVEKNGQSFQFLLTLGGQLIHCTKKGRFVSIGRYAESGKPVKLLGQLETPQGNLMLSMATPQTPQRSLLLEVDARGQTIRRRVLPHRLKPIWCEPDGTVYLQASPPPAGAPALPRLSAHLLDQFLFRLAPDGTLSPLPIPFAASPFADNDPTLLNGAQARYDPIRKLFWISGKRTCFAWHPTHGVIFDLRKTDLFTNSMQLFWPAFIDRTGAVWFGTEDGVVLITVEADRFKRYLYQADPKSDAARFSIRGMVPQGNRMWVNTTTSQWLQLETGRSEPLASPTDSVQQYLKGLYPAIGTSRGDIWAAETYLIHRDGATNRFRVYPFVRNWTDNFGSALWHDGRHRVWIGHEHGISVFDERQKQVRAFDGYNGFSELAQNRINGFFPDDREGGGRYAASPASANRSSQIWVAASSGLYLLDSLRGITARYSTHNNTLPFDHIMFVHPDPEQAGVYWLATRGGGLVRWNRRTGQYQQFTQKDGLSDNTLYAIYEDHAHRLWLPSNYGLMAFHRQTHQVRIFHVRNGIADEEFNRTSFCRTADGQLFFGGLNGITAFYPDQIQFEKPAQAPMLITGYHKLNVNTGQTVDYLADYQKQGEIELTANDRLISLSFSVLDYRFLNKTRLWYRIVGWQDKWDIQPQMDLRMNGLPAGSYTLKVRAQTINGDWVSPVLSIPIRIAKPFYLQTWFVLLMLLLVLSLFLVEINRRNQRFVLERAKLEEEVARRTAQIERDKSIIEQQAADLRANATLKTRFFANVSHEFRTPLTLILGPIQYLAKRISDVGTLQLLQAMERNTQQMLGLVTDLLNMTRFDSGQFGLNEQPAELTQTIRQLVDTFRPQAQFNGVDLWVTGLDTPLTLPLDTEKFETVLRNVVANAIHYTSLGDSIIVRLTRTDGHALIDVIDTGLGIHPDDLPHIFERYFQSNQPDKPLRGGTGIGLALCQEYCALWGGTITVSSEIGKGCTFRIAYPIRPFEQGLVQHSTTTAAVLSPDCSPTLGTNLGSDNPLFINPPGIADEIPGVSQPSILLIDDNPDIILYVQTLLRPYYRVSTVQNGREALSILSLCPQNQLPQLIISDIMMPEVDGLALVSELRSNALLRSIPVILLTARADLEVRLQALQLGVADYLTKPFSESELLTRVQNLLDRFDEQRVWQQAEGAGEVIALATMNDADWLQFVQFIIRKNLINSQLTIKSLSEIANVSERQLYRRTKTLTGLSPNQLIQEIRLQVAHELFELHPEAMIKTIALQVGYQKASYFSRLYRDRFGHEPGKRYEQETAL